MKAKEIREAYDEILDILRKHDVLHLVNAGELERQVELYLFGLELKETYGLNIDPSQIKDLDYQRFGSFGSHKIIGLFGKKYNREISWPSDGRQPKNERLFVISIPTGAYFFGDVGVSDCPIEFFQKFWLELKSYNPDYVDDVNKALYWKLENAKEIFNDYDSIVKKYHELNKEDAKQRKIKKMREEIERLESSTKKEM
jgi:hypothetical protein